jgi:hypothetical protein
VRKNGCMILYHADRYPIVLTHPIVHFSPRCVSTTKANYFSRTFLFAAIVVIMQAGMLIVTFINIVDLGPDGTQSKYKEGYPLLASMVNTCLIPLTCRRCFPAVTNGVSNRLRIPPGVTTTLSLAQFLGTFHPSDTEMP